MLFLECYVTCYQYTFIATGTGYYLKLFARIWTSLNQSFVWLAEEKNAMQKIINLMCAKVDFWALRQRCSFSRHDVFRLIQSQISTLMFSIFLIALSL